MLDDLDTCLSVIDIIICILDMGLICYLFFIRLPMEKKKPFISRLRRQPRNHRCFRRVR